MTAEWPQYLTTADAARYVGFKTTGGIRKARLEGRLTPFGRRGGTGRALSWIDFSEVIPLLRSARIVWERLHSLEAQMKQQKWIMQWKNWIAPTRISGVWQRKEGGHLVRTRVTDPTTGARREIKKVLPEADEATAYKWLRDEQEKIRQGLVEAEQPKTRFSDYAVSLLERKLVTKEIKSARGRERWVHTLRHLIEGTATVPGFGELFVDEIRPRHIEAWRTGVATLIAANDYAPTTANGWLYILKHVLKRAKRELQLPFNAAEGTSSFDTSEHEIYTEEEPNALTSEETASFLACMRTAASDRSASLRRRSPRSGASSA